MSEFTRAEGVVVDPSLDCGHLYVRDDQGELRSLADLLYEAGAEEGDRVLINVQVVTRLPRKPVVWRT